MTSDEAIEKSEECLAGNEAVRYTKGWQHAELAVQRGLAYATLALALQEKERVDARIALDLQEYNRQHARSDEATGF